MPTYTIQAPNGQTIRIPAPDFTSAMQAAEGYVRAGTGYLTTAAQAVPFLTEAGAGYSAGLRSLDDMLSGRKPDLAQNWTRARAEQQAVVDSFQREHPFLANNATALGTVAPMAAAGLGLSRAARPAASLLPGVVSNDEAAGGGGAMRKLAGGALRNAFTGGGVGALYGAARPGTAEQRAQYAADAVAPGALWGAAIPAGVKAAAFAAPRVGAVGSELMDTLNRATGARTPVDQLHQVSADVGALPRLDAVRLLRQMGVTPDAIENAQRAALGKPITTAEAIGPSGMALAQGLRGRSGATDAMADAFLENRAVTRPTRILGDIQQATGLRKGAMLGDVRQIFERNRGGATPIFNDAYNKPPPKEDTWNLMNQRLTRPHTDDIRHQFVDKGLEFLDDVRLDGDDNPNTRAMPTVIGIDYLKNRLQDVLYGTLDPLNEVNTIMRNVSDELHSTLLKNGEDGKAYAAAFNAGGDLFSTESAFRNAQGKILDPLMDSSRFESEFDALQPFARETLKAAAANDLTRLGYYQPFDPTPLWDPAVRQKLNLLFGDEGYATLAKSFGLENKMGQFEERPPGGLAGLGLRLRAAAQAPLNMAGRNALGDLLFQDAGSTAQIMRRYGQSPNAFEVAGTRLPPGPHYGWLGQAEMTTAPGQLSSANDP